MAGLELAIDRLIDAPRDAVWRAWTDHLAEWWCPRPWTTEVVEQDLRVGGRSALVMRGPGGEVAAADGVFLEVVPGRRVVLTNFVDAGWVPQPAPQPFPIITFFEFADEGGGTRYHAGARHWDADAMARHEAMGFHQGWNAVADQLEAVAKRIA